MLAKIKQFIKENRGDILLFLFIVLACLACFALGFLASTYWFKQPLEFIGF